MAQQLLLTLESAVFFCNAWSELELGDPNSTGDAIGSSRSIFITRGWNWDHLPIFFHGDYKFS